MAGDLNREASELWNSLKPIIDKEIDSRTQGMVQRRKAKVTTAPSLATNTIGVTEPFGPEMFLPFNTNIMSASVGDFVWVEYMYGMTNAFVSMFASADDKNQYVAGNLTVDGVLDVPPRRCYASLSSSGWYRVMQYTTSTTGAQWASGVKIDFAIATVYNTVNNSLHNISMVGVYNHVAFMNELSYSNATIVDKIRYTYGDDGNGYVDIHYNNSGSNYVSVDFAVHYRQTEQANISSVALTPVADSPSRETVLTEYTFGDNGTFLQNINGFLNPNRTTIANGATGNIQFSNSSSAYLLVTGVGSSCYFIVSVRCNSGGAITHYEMNIGSGSMGASITTASNTLSITNSSGYELQMLILRF